MGFLGSILGSDKQETKNQILYPPYIEDASRGVLERASELADQPWVRYGGDRDAVMSPYSKQGINYATMAQGSFLPFLQNAGAHGESAVGLQGSVLDYTDPTRAYEAQMWSPEAAQRYMSPYISGALQPTIDKMMETTRRDVLGTRAASTAQNALGGTRQAILESERERQLQDAVGDVYGEGLDRAYQSAFGAFTSDQNRTQDTIRLNESLRNQELNRLQQVSSFFQSMQDQEMSIAEALQDLQGVDITRMLAAGEFEQKDRQRLLDTAYDDWVEERDWGSRGLKLLIEGLNAARGSRNETTTEPGASPLTTIIGAISSLYGAGMFS